MFGKKKPISSEIIRYTGYESYFNVLIVDGQYANILSPGQSAEYPATTHVTQLNVASKDYDIEWDSGRLTCKSDAIKMKVHVLVKLDPAKIVDALRAFHYTYNTYVKFNFGPIESRIAHFAREWCSDVTKDYINENRTELADYIKAKIENHIGPSGFITKDVYVVRDLLYVPKNQSSSLQAQQT